MAESGDANLGSAFSNRVIAEVSWWSLNHSQREKITAVSLSQCVLMSATCLQHVSLQQGTGVMTQAFGFGEAVFVSWFCP